MEVGKNILVFLTCLLCSICGVRRHFYQKWPDVRRTKEPFSIFKKKSVSIPRRWKGFYFNNNFIFQSHSVKKSHNNEFSHTKILWYYTRRSWWAFHWFLENFTIARPWTLLCLCSSLNKAKGIWFAYRVSFHVKLKALWFSLPSLNQFHALVEHFLSYFDDQDTQFLDAVLFTVVIATWKFLVQKANI